MTETPSLERLPTADYSQFLSAKSQLGGACGFEPLWVPDFLKDFQRHLTLWNIRKGRAADFADCGLGKTVLELVFGENVVRHTNRPFLIAAPLGVSMQIVREAEKFGVDCVRCQDSRPPAGARVVVTNYERLESFDPADYSGMAADESGMLKNFDGKRKAVVTEFMRTLPYRLLCSATPAPNDYVELGTSSEALGGLGFQDMVSRFFIKETRKDYLGWGRTKYRMRTHAVGDFWRWVCSWARACRRPSDLGFDDGEFILPELVTREHEVKASRPPDGKLFDTGAKTLRDQQEEQRRTIKERCEKVAELVTAHNEPAVCWCHLNDEGDLIERLVPGAVQLSGSEPVERKEEKLLAFSAGQIRVLVTKGKIAGFGLNWQHCAHQTYFPSHSFEQWYQCVRRSWRFGQTRPVVVDVITTEGGAGVLASLRRKEADAAAMFSELVRLMNDSLHIDRPAYGGRRPELPPWIGG